MDQSIVTADIDGVRIITLNRPDRLNAINLEMIRGLEETLEAAQDLTAVRAILLRGAGRAFCAGDDVTAQAEICNAGEAALRDQLKSLQRISELLTLGSKPSIAAVRGWAVGAGFSWILNCDLSLWSDDAAGFFPEVSFGTFVTGGASYLLPRLVHPSRATNLLLRGTRLSAKDAFDYGLAHAVLADARLDEAAGTIAAELASLPSQAAQAMKRAVADGQAEAMRAAFKREIEACVATTLDPATLARMRDAIRRS